jgi:phosphoenolpyruvate carboxylase
MISSKYLLPPIAQRTLELISSAVILSSSIVRKQNSTDVSEYHQYLEQASETAFKKYRTLVESDNFQEYFRKATPIDIVEQIEIGSRPASRKKGSDLSSLRAIPWVFSWTQNRQTISGWYGFGSAISELIGQKKISWKELNEIYKKWPFFNVLIDNIEMVLLKTDMIIGREYAALYPKGRSIFNLIEKEYNLSVKAVLKITNQKYLMDSNPSLQRSILLRNPYIDPISFIQLKFIKQFRKARSKTQKAKLLYLLRSTVNGIAAGIRNTG